MFFSPSLADRCYVKHTLKDKTTRNNTTSKVSSVSGTGLKWDKDGHKTARHGRHNCIAGSGPRRDRMCSTSSEYIDMEHFSIHTASSISLTAGESENNRDTHNTMAGYWHWPPGTVKSSCGCFIFFPSEGVLIVTASTWRRTNKTQIKISNSNCPHCAITPRYHITIHRNCPCVLSVMNQSHT